MTKNKLIVYNGLYIAFYLFLYLFVGGIVVKIVGTLVGLTPETKAIIKWSVSISINIGVLLILYATIFKSINIIKVFTDIQGVGFLGININKDRHLLTVNIKIRMFLQNPSRSKDY